MAAHSDAGRPGIEQARISRLIPKLKAMTIGELSEHCTQVLAAHSGLDLVVERQSRFCGWCDTELPVGVDLNRRYCDLRCAKAMRAARAKAARAAA